MIVPRSARQPSELALLLYKSSDGELQDEDQIKHLHRVSPPKNIYQNAFLHPSRPRLRRGRRRRSSESTDDVWQINVDALSRLMIVSRTSALVRPRYPRRCHLPPTSTSHQVRVRRPALRLMQATARASTESTTTHALHLTIPTLSGPLLPVGRSPRRHR